jgi:WD40 repeat protein
MKLSFGPWSTSIHGTTPGLSAFWKRRMAMLHLIRKTPARLSRREVLALGGAGLMSCAVPTLYAGRRTARQTALRLPVPPPEILGNENHVLTLAWSPDGATLAMGVETDSESRWVELWDAGTGKKRGQVEGWSWEVAFSPDGKTLATVTTPDYSIGEVRLWDVKTLERTQTILTDSQPQSTDMLHGLSWSPDGKRIACGGYSIRELEMHGEVQLLSLETAQLEQVLTHSVTRVGEDTSAGIVTATAFSPDGKTLASATHGGTTAVKLWDLRSGTMRLEITGHGQYVSALAFAPDGQTVASGSSDETVMLSDTTSGDLRHTLRHAAKVRTLAYSPDGSLLATATTDHVITLWNPRSGEQLTQLKGHTGTINGLAFSPDGRRLASGSYDQTVRLWKMDARKEV